VTGPGAEEPVPRPVGAVTAPAGRKARRGRAVFEAPDRFVALGVA